jgi:DNA-binding CsgD family transcriptional regulator
MKKIILAICDNTAVKQKYNEAIIDTNICNLMIIDAEATAEDEKHEIPIISFSPKRKTPVSQKLINDLLSPDNQVYFLVVEQDENLIEQKIINNNDNALRMIFPAAKYNLTRMESLILDDLVNGLCNQQIADKHHISCHTVKNHITHIYKKLNVKKRAALVYKYASQN